MNLHLLIPSLFWPDTAFTQIYGDLPLPSLEKLLAKSSRADNEPQELEPWLCRAFSVAKQEDWPVAPITLAIDGNGKIKAGEDYWVRADPVHLHIEHDQILLADSRVFKISSSEADELTDLLNRHFKANGQKMSFLPLQPDRWYLCATEIAPTKTHLLSEAINKSIRTLLPFGANDAVWRSLFNEIQMLLHEHPLNQSRESRSEPAINSTWFWGSGVMPKSIVSPYTRVWANDLLAGSLALASRTDHAKLPPDAKALSHPPASGHHLAVLDVLHGKAQYGDAYGWRESLKNLEQNWFEPVLRMLSRGVLAQVILTAVGGGKTRNFTVRSGDLRKFWRRGKPLSAYTGRAD